MKNHLKGGNYAMDLDNQVYFFFWAQRYSQTSLR